MNQYTRIRYVRQDLFTAPQNVSLAHCVAADLGMRGGIAVDFRERFGDKDHLRMNANFYGRRHQSNQNEGILATLPENNRFIYYLITKPRSNQRPTYLSIRKSLVYMRSHAELHEVKKIAMPRIASGLDRWKWYKIERIIKDVFRDSKVQIDVYMPPVTGYRVNHSTSNVKYTRYSA